MNAAAFTGSSPLARGTPRHREPDRVRIRFIPARAGNTLTAPNRPRPAPVHPRSRGEHLKGMFRERSCPGSSPLARGTRLRHRGPEHPPRFIPARAGNTMSTWPDEPSDSVHPRSRGEHWSRMERAHSGFGSSPLARGTRRRARPRLQPRRFIPARAGNTSPASPRRSCAPVHPRSRGEHGCPRTATTTPAGSSPLARGTPQGLHVGAALDRFIPARAGNTRPRRSGAAPIPVHPRSRGEHAPRQCRGCL